MPYWKCNSYNETHSLDNIISKINTYRYLSFIIIITLQASVPSPGRLLAHNMVGRIEMCFNSPFEYLDSLIQFSFFMIGSLT